MNFSVDTLYLRLPFGPELNPEVGILTMFQTDSSLRGVRFFALWWDSWHIPGLEDCRFKFLQAFPKLEELSIISDNDGLSPETEGPNSWNEGSEMRFLDSPEYETLSPEKKSDRDYMTMWDDRRDSGVGPNVVDASTYQPPNFMFRTVQRDHEAPWTQHRSEG